jgi:hypothetical protein
MIVCVGGFSEEGRRHSSFSFNSSGTATPAESEPSSPSVASAPFPESDSPVPKTLVPSTAYLAPSLQDAQPLSKEAAKKEAQRQAGIIVDADREVQFKFLLGKSGKKHGALPSMVRPFLLVLFILATVG